MKSLVVLFLVLSSCGYSSRQSEMIGQVKKVVHKTPILCFERTDVDISLGVLRNGVGSMSAQDVWLTVKNQKDVDTLTQANESGALVKVKYDEARVNFCWNEHEITSVEIVK